MATVFVLFLLFQVYSICSPNVEVAMCNKEKYIPRYDSLTAFDLTRIKKLEQVHIISRHGSRTGDHSVQSIFAQINASIPNTEWKCNFTTITSRNYGGQSFMSLQKNYVPNEEVIGVNCVDSQSTSQVIHQHEKNAKLVRDYYIGDEARNLFTKQEVDTIIDDIFTHRKYKDNNTPFIKIISDDLERTYSTASVFMTYFLKYSDNISKETRKKWIYNGNTDYLYSYTHDIKSDPYVPQKNAKCTKLKKYITDIGKSSETFQDYINSDYVQSFWKQWKQEIGSDINASDEYFKICENIIWMFCGDINLIPDVLSEDLFKKILNYTLEYRSKLLNNGDASKEAVKLASMPLAWILRTMISDHIAFLQGNYEDIDGYLDAEQAKLVFHSTRGISTLYFMIALGLSDGIEPVYANLVNVEIYSRAGCYGYLFRITKMGKFIAFPGCQDDYFNGTSTLCNLNVLIETLNGMAMPLKEWEVYCSNVTGDYFATKKIVGVGVEDENVRINHVHSNTNYGVGLWWFVSGALFGAVVLWAVERISYFKNVFKEHYTVVK